MNPTDPHTKSLFSLKDSRSPTTYDLIMDRLTPGDHDLNFILPLLDKSLDVLDVGCGTGRVGRQTSSYVNKLTGLDQSEEMLNRYQELGLPENTDLVLGSVADEGLFPHEHFDVIIALLGPLNYVSGIEQFEFQLKNITSWIKPGGIIVLDCFSKEAYARMQGHHDFPINIGNTTYQLTLKIGFHGKLCTCVTELSDDHGSSQSGFTETFLPLTQKDLADKILEAGLILQKPFANELHPGFHCFVAQKPV